MTDRRFIYFVDPMCSWCWGFSPTITRVVEQYCGDIPIEPIMGGLRPGTTDALDREGKKYIRGHWEHVHKATGQPFDFTFFDRDGFVYDTEPACRAVVAMRRLAPENVMAYLASIQRALYADGRDVTTGKILTEVATELGVDGEKFLAIFESDEARAETRGDFTIARKARVRGFPTLVAGTSEGALTAITTGYQAWENIEKAIDGWLEDSGESVRES